MMHINSIVTQIEVCLRDYKFRLFMFWMLHASWRNPFLFQIWAVVKSLPFCSYLCDTGNILLSFASIVLTLWFFRLPYHMVLLSILFTDDFFFTQKSILPLSKQQKKYSYLLMNRLDECIKPWLIFFSLLKKKNQKKKISAIEFNHPRKRLMSIIILSNNARNEIWAWHTWSPGPKIR